MRRQRHLHTLSIVSSNRRHFHDYFVTQLPSSSLHPDSRSSASPRHNLPRSASKPHTPRSYNDPSPAPVIGTSRDTTVVRIPLRSAKHHFGVFSSRGQRPHNEDAHQAGVIEIPAFAKRMPISLTTRAPPSSPLQAYREKQRIAQEQVENEGDGTSQEGTSAQNTSGDPQVFYFGVFDGHGGAECSDFLRQSLHEYIESAVVDFEMKSTLKGPELRPRRVVVESPGSAGSPTSTQDISNPRTGNEQEAHNIHGNSQTRTLPPGSRDTKDALEGSPEVPQQVNVQRALDLEKDLTKGWKKLVGGYFKRYKPELFSHTEGGNVSISTILTYAFLRADYEFVSAQARKPDDDNADAPLNAYDVLDSPALRIGGTKRFKGGSTCSLALISTPSPTPFWHPSAPSTLVVAHVGDTRILLCRTSDGAVVPLTTNHHPSNPSEGRRLRRYAGNIVTDSFGEERMSGLANTRAFGDIQSKRIGVSAEPEIRRIELAAAEYSFLLLMSDGVSGTLSDQEVVDIVKEGRTPEQGARDVVSFATEVTTEGDNATCICVRLGGWERRSEGGLGSFGTKESRQYRREEAADPRGRRQ
ncbi:MAG: hypothetical protein LQ340_001168 [Diploschistes diacapsis]|nr:MAG: hypothetical protein LQ340_001168 [Diploschistes diacapsis]